MSLITKVNSLLKINTKEHIRSFTDDTAILYQRTTWTDLKTESKTDFKFIKQRFQQKKCTLNIDKTKYLPIALYVNHLPNMGLLNVENVKKIPK